MNWTEYGQRPQRETHKDGARDEDVLQDERHGVRMFRIRGSSLVMCVDGCSIVIDC